MLFQCKLWWLESSLSGLTRGALYPRLNSPAYPFIRILVLRQNRSACFGEAKKSLALSEIEKKRFLSFPASRPATMATTLSLCLNNIKKNIWWHKISICYWSHLRHTPSAHLQPIGMLFMIYLTTDILFKTKPCNGTYKTHQDTKLQWNWNSSNFFCL